MPSHKLYILLLLLLLLLLTANGFIPGGSVLQRKAGQYNAVQCNTIQHITIHITQNNIQNSRKPSIGKITKKKYQNTCYTLLRLRNE